MRSLITLALAVAAIAAIGATAAAAKPPGTNGKIVTNSDNRVTGAEEIYTVNQDGTGRHLLGFGETGKWSPDGTNIALGLDCCGAGILNFDSGVFTALHLDTLYPNLFLGCGTWSPDGASLACEGGFIDPTLQGVFTVRSSDGGGLQQITSDPFGDDCPSDYSPSGKRLVVTVGPPDGPPALFVVNLQGRGRQQITPPGMEFNFCNGSWSPQGNEILFSAHVPDGSYHSSIWVVHTDGSGLRQIPVPGCGGPNADPTTIGCFTPTWSPDGKKIVFARRRGNEQSDLYTVNADGRGLFQVTNTPDIDEFGGDWGTHPVTQ
jgi:Tol biopolymer transport system component